MPSLTFPIIDPIAFSIGPFAIRWYALAYVTGLLGGWFYAKRLAARADLWIPQPQPKPLDIDDLIVWVALGVVLGGRLGYVLFYNLSTYLAQPARNLRRVARRDVVSRRLDGRGARHRAVFARGARLNPLTMLDLASTVAPIGLFFGRIANFINGELWGRPRAGFSLRGGVSPCGPPAPSPEPAL